MSPGKLVPQTTRKAPSAPLKETFNAPTVLQMAGSDIYCTVIQEATGNAVACFHDPGGPTSNVRKGLKRS